MVSIGTPLIVKSTRKTCLVCQILRMVPYMSIYLLFNTFRNPFEQVNDILRIPQDNFPES